jgi:hypothetical protein
MTVDSKNIIEIMIGLLGIVGAISSFAIYLATLSERNQLKSSVNKLAQKFQRITDRNKSELGLLKMKMRDIEAFSEKQGFYVRGEFPSENLPSENSDFIDN